METKTLIQRKLYVVGLNIPHDTTPQQVSELIWEKTGLKTDPACISVQNSGTFSASAFVPVTESDLADFLTYNLRECVLDGQRSAIRFETKIWKHTRSEDRPEQKFRNYKVDFQTVITLPDGKR
jgi:hypothetical protein